MEGSATATAMIQGVGAETVRLLADVFRSIAEDESEQRQDRADDADSQERVGPTPADGLNQPVIQRGDHAHGQGRAGADDADGQHRSAS